jgi:hypothetical protein
MTAMREARGCMRDPSRLRIIRVVRLKGFGHGFSQMNTEFKNVTTEDTECTEENR